MSFSAVEGGWMTGPGYTLHFWMLKMRWIPSSNSFKTIYLIFLPCCLWQEYVSAQFFPARRDPHSIAPRLDLSRASSFTHLLPMFDTALNSFIPCHEFSLELCFLLVTSESPLSRWTQVVFAQCFCARCQAAESVLCCLNSFLTATSSGPSPALLGMWQWGRGRTRGNCFSLAEALVLDEPWCSWTSLELRGGCWRQYSSSMKSFVPRFICFGQNGID